MLKKCNDFLDNIMWSLSKKTAHTIWHAICNKKIMHWTTPITYDEKLRWLLVNAYGRKEAYYADKLSVRDYVKECGYESILVPIYGEWTCVEDICFEKLPKQFVMKTNHGSGADYYSIIYDKEDAIFLKTEMKKLNKTLHTDFGKHRSQYHYSYIQPKVYCEKLLVEEGKDRLDDYKILCANGVPRYILVCSERNKGRDYFDIYWNCMPFVKEKYKNAKLPKKPAKLAEMLAAAERLSKPFTFARIDFYCIKDRIYFGEITLSPSSCNQYYLNAKGQEALGKMIMLPT